MPGANWSDCPLRLFQELSLARLLCICKHPAYKSAPTSTHNVRLNLRATDYPNLAELRIQSNTVEQGASRGAGSARTGVFRDVSRNVAKPPVKMQLSTHQNSLRRIAEQVGVRPRFSRKLSRSKRTRTESTVTAVLRWLRSNAVGQLKVLSFEKEIGFRKSRTSRGSSQVFGEAENGHADQH